MMNSSGTGSSITQNKNYKLLHMDQRVITAHQAKVKNPDRMSGFFII
jgi:hypothetical protein